MDIKANLAMAKVIMTPSKYSLKNGANYVFGDLVPQGICEKDGYFFVSAYDGDKKATTKIYALSVSTGKLLASMDTGLITHGGGVTVAGGYLWTVGEGKAYYFDYKPIKDYIEAKPDATKVFDLTKITHGKMKVTGQEKASYVTTYKDNLCIGEFYEDKKGIAVSYEPMVKDGGELKAVAKLPVPVKAQGIDFTTVGGVTYVLNTCSYGRNNDSTIVVSKINKADGSSKLETIKTLTFPCMAEELIVKGDKVYIVYESCGGTYRKDAKQVIDYIGEYPISLFI